MNKQDKTMAYLSPKVTVVAFMIEQGFTGSNMRAESLGTTPGTEDVTENANGNLNNGYFPRSI